MPPKRRAAGFATRASDQRRGQQQVGVSDRKETASRRHQKPFVPEQGKPGYLLRSRGPLSNFVFQSPPRVTRQKQRKSASNGRQDSEADQPSNQHENTIHPSIETEEPIGLLQASEQIPTSTIVSSSTIQSAERNVTDELLSTVSERLYLFEAKRELYLSHGLDSEEMSSVQDSNSQLRTPGGSDGRTPRATAGRRVSAQQHTKTFRELLEEFGIHKNEMKSNKPISTLERSLSSECQLCQNHWVSDDGEKYWEVDRDRCIDRPEALFQHTIMMDILGRHELDLKLFEYSCETAWRSKSLPRWENRPGGLLLSKPKPDLTVGFQPYMIFPESSKKPYIKTLFNSMCPEDLKDAGCAFPFFFLEAKGASGTLTDDIASLQVKNDAAQALYNIWKFVKTAKMQKRYFSTIRIFSATAHASRIRFRMHWAESEHIEHITHKDSRRRRLWYENKIIMTFPQVGMPYSKTKVLAYFHNILRYAKHSMQPFLRDLVANETARSKKFGAHASSEEIDAKTPTPGPKKRKRSFNPTGTPPIDILPQSSGGAEQQPIDNSPANISFQSNDSTPQHLTRMNLHSGNP